MNCEIHSTMSQKQGDKSGESEGEQEKKEDKGETIEQYLLYSFPPYPCLLQYAILYNNFSAFFSEMTYQNQGIW